MGDPPGSSTRRTVHRDRTVARQPIQHVGHKVHRDEQRPDGYAARQLSRLTNIQEKRTRYRLFYLKILTRVGQGISRRSQSPPVGRGRCSTWNVRALSHEHAVGHPSEQAADHATCRVDSTGSSGTSFG